VSTVVSRLYRQGQWRKYTCSNEWRKRRRLKRSGLVPRQGVEKLKTGQMVRQTSETEHAVDAPMGGTALCSEWQSKLAALCAIRG